MSSNQIFPTTYSDAAIEAGKRIERVIVSHPGFARAKEQLMRLSDRAHKLRDPGGMVLTGESGTGKDSLIEEMMTLLPTSELLNSSQRPLIVAHSDSVPSIGDYTTKMLMRLGYPFAKFGNTDNQERREVLISAIAGCRVQLLLINEFQHIVEGRRDKSGHNMTDWFKRLYDDTRIPMVFLGTPAMERALQINEQFASRFSGRYRLRPLENSRDFLGVLKAFDSTTSDLAPTGLENAIFSHRIHRATGGVMRPLKRLIKEAVMLAVTVSAPKLSMAHLAEAYDRLFCEGGSGNPFVS